VQHYFQAQKFVGTPREEEIRNAPTPQHAKNLGFSKSTPIRSDWEAVKQDVMKIGLLAKFTQHEDLKQLLLSTGDRVIFRHAGDEYWADKMDGTGQNHIGKIMMVVRTMLQESK